MSDLELVLTMLAEATTTEISKTEKPATFQENQEIAQKGGSIAGNARKQIEDATGKPVVTSKNAGAYRRLVNDVIKDAPAIPELAKKKESHSDK